MSKPLKIILDLVNVIALISTGIFVSTHNGIFDNKMYGAYFVGAFMGAISFIAWRLNAPSDDI